MLRGSLRRHCSSSAAKASWFASTWASSRSSSSSSSEATGDVGYHGHTGPGMIAYSVDEMAHIPVCFPVCITNLNRRVLRRDVHELLESAGCHIDPRHIRVEYSQSLQPAAWWASLPTAEDQLKALSLTDSYMGTRRVRVRTTSPDIMKKAVMNPLTINSRGRFVWITGLQTNVTVEDIKRFLHDYDLMAHPVTVIRREPQSVFIAPPAGLPIYTPEAGRMDTHSRALVRFTSAEEASRAVREKTGEPLLNSRALLRVLP